MSPSPDSAQPSSSVESLLDHSEWLQALARRLARDESSAQDLVQRVWLAALRRPPKERGTSLRGWLATVLRNEARMTRRANLRRIEREVEQLEGLSREAAAAPDDELVLLEERFELQLQLMSAVRALQPPLRALLLLRYFEQQPLAAIAERTGTPVRTVEAQLRRGRELLRERLDGHFGERLNWTALTLPLGLPLALPGSVSESVSESVSGAPVKGAPDAAAQGPGATAGGPAFRPPIKVISTATAIMGTKTLLAAAATVVALIIGSSLLQDSDASGDMTALDPTTRREENATAETEPSMASVDSGSSQRLSPGASSAPAAPEAQAAAPVRRMVRGVAFHGNGTPYSGLDLRLTPPLSSVGSVQTSTSGKFAFEAELPKMTSAKITPESDELVVLASRSISSELWTSDLPGFIAVSPAALVHGVVRSDDGDPIVGASLALGLPEKFAARFSDTFWRVELSDWEVLSTADGKFLFPAAPGLEGCVLTVQADGFKPTTKVLPAGAETPREANSLELVLERIDPRVKIAGRVVDPQGNPVEDAWVGLGCAMEGTGADGRFEFQAGEDKTAFRVPTQLVAAAKGWQITTFDPPLDGEGAAVWPASIELRFTREALSISGVLLDAEGSPKADAIVWIQDPSVMGVRGGSAFTAESFMGAQGYLWQKYPTDGEGRFSIPGLVDREYKVAAVDLQTMHLTVPKRVRGGTEDAVLQLDPSVPMARVAGRIVDARGEGVPETVVSLRRIALFLNHPDGSSANIEHAETEETRTDERGQFDLGVLPLHPGTSLYLHRRGYIMRELVFADLPPPLDDLEVELNFRCRARIIAGDLLPNVPTYAEVRTAAGEALEATTALENGASYSTHIGLTDGNSKTFEVSGAAVEVVLYAKGKVVATLPLRLEPDGVNEIVP